MTPKLTPKLSRLWSIDSAGVKTVSVQQDGPQANGFFRELQLLSWRSFQNQIRTPELFYVRLALVSFRCGKFLHSGLVCDLSFEALCGGAKS